MKTTIKGLFSIRTRCDYVEIEIEDFEASSRILTLRMPPEDFCAALGGLSCVGVDGMQLYNLEKVGKKHECEEFVFEIPENLSRKSGKEELQNLCNYAMGIAGKGGWKADSGYNSQNSFFSKDDKRFAKTIIRRWV